MIPTISVRNTVASIQKLIGHEWNILKHDKFLIKVEGGTGGSGIARYNAIGGTGGDVFFVAKPSMSFSSIRKSLSNRMKIRGENGEVATKICLTGRPGKPKYFDVPVGTEVLDMSRRHVVAKCNKPYKPYLIARGGQGGGPRTAYRSSKGESLDVELHIKLQSNIGLLGFPNAGKSTLMKALVPEKSIKIAEYPFTTLHPQIAFWKNSHEDLTSEAFTLSVADLPGIIEGASRNRGRGYSFLKHLENADIILMVVDSNGFQLKNDASCPFRNPIQTIALLNREVESYNSEMLKKPVVCVLNKIDTLDQNNLERITELSSLLRSGNWAKHVDIDLRPKKEMMFEHVVQVSAKTGSIEQLQKTLNVMKDYFRLLKDSSD